MIVGEKMCLVRTLIATAVFIGLAQVASSNGFRNPPDGAAALGRDGGKIAHIDDPSAITHNPANLTEFQDVEAMGAVNFIYYEIEYDSLLGGSAKTEDDLKVLPNLYGVFPIHEDLVGAVGITTPFGQSTRWPNDSPFRYTAPRFAELITVNINPTLAKKVSDTLSVGVGLDLFWSNLYLDQIYPWFLVVGAPVPDGLAEFDAEGYGAGGNVAVSWKPVEGHTVAVTYRSPVKVDYEGDFKISKFPLPAAPVGPAPRSDFDTEIEFPGMVTIGYGLQVNDDVRIGVDAEWVEFSSFDKLDLNIGRNGVLFPVTTLPQNWDDIWTFGVSGDWVFSETGTLRLGYKYLETPIPDATFSPTIYDANKHNIAVGVGFKDDGGRVDITYALTILEDRDIKTNLNPAFNGDYSVGLSHILSVSYGKTF